MEAPCAPPVHDQLATIVNNLTREKLPDEMIATKYKLYDRPENFDALIPVKVNPPILLLLLLFKVFSIGLFNAYVQFKKCLKYKICSTTISAYILQ